MIVYSPDISNRLRYMADWFGNYLFGEPLIITGQRNELVAGEAVINYSNETLPLPAFHIQPNGLLSEEIIGAQNIQVIHGSAMPFFYATGGDYPFDIFSAIFYLISRYEEYLPHEKDEYGRYAHTNSLAFQHGFLQRPIVDEWMTDFKAALQQAFPALEFAKRSFTYITTYDVDIAWSNLNKGFTRLAGGLLKQLATGNLSAAKERIDTLTGNNIDPFDVFDDLQVLHEKFDLKPIYFFLLAEKQKGYDKNISPYNPAYRQLIRGLSQRNKNGIHLSWQAYTSSPAMATEKRLFHECTGQDPVANRMHYIKFDLPGTFEQLESLGIKEDYSMGYGSINGFRASTCTPYTWYNLAKEQITGLTIFPYCYMEANSIFEQKDDPQTALREMQHYHDVIKKTGGTFITIFHNHLIGRSEEGRRWWQLYVQFLERNCSMFTNK